MSEAAPKKVDPRIFTLVSVLLVVAIVAGGWVLGIQPALTSAASAETQASSQIQSNQALRIRLAALAKQATSLAALKTQAASLKAAVPSTLDAKAFVREVNLLATTRGLTVGSVAPGTPVAYTVPASIQAEQAASAAAATATASATATATAAAESSVKPQAVADSSITSANFTVIPVSVQVTGTMAQTLAFVKDLESDNRLFLVAGYSASQNAATAAATSSASSTADAAASSTSTTYDATITGYLYALKSLS